MARSIIVSFQLLAVTAATAVLSLGCSSDDHARDATAKYGERLQEVKRISNQHHREVARANTTAEIAEAEQRYDEQMHGTLADMGQAVSDLGTCEDHASHTGNAAAMHSDVEAMRSMHNQHHKAMINAADVDEAKAHEDAHRAAMNDEFGTWSQHHRNMSDHAEGCTGDHDHMGGHMMGGGHMRGGMMGH